MPITEKEREKYKRHRESETYKRTRAKYKASGKYIRTRRNGHYKRKFGMTYGEVEKMIEDQNGLCPIGFHPLGPMGRADDSPCLDHNHETGEIRGIICRKHNKAIGLLGDSIAELQSCIVWLTSKRG